MTHSINLLPWREMQRTKYRQLFFFKSAATVAGALLFVGLSHSFLQNQLDEQNSRNARLQKEITELNLTLKEFSTKKIARDKLQYRLELVNALQNQRNNPTMLLNLLPQITPEGVILDSVSMEGNKVTLEGRSQTNGALASLLAQLEKNKEAKNVQMHSIVNQAKNSKTDPAFSFANQFRATFNLTNYVTPNLPVEKKDVR